MLFQFTTLSIQKKNVQFNKDMSLVGNSNAEEEIVLEKCEDKSPFKAASKDKVCIISLVI